MTFLGIADSPSLAFSYLNELLDVFILWHLLPFFYLGNCHEQDSTCFTADCFQLDVF